MSGSLLGKIFSMAPAALFGAPSGGVVTRSVQSGGDSFDGGVFSISDTVGIKSSPDLLGPYRVRLYCKVSGRFVRETWSDGSGNYRFKNIRPGPWFVVAHDHTGTYNAVIADSLTAT